MLVTQGLHRAAAAHAGASALPCVPTPHYAMQTLRMSSKGARAVVLHPTEDVVTAVDAHGIAHVMDHRPDREPLAYFLNCYHVISGTPCDPRSTGHASLGPPCTIVAAHVINGLEYPMFMACAADGAVRVWARCGLASELCRPACRRCHLHLALRSIYILPTQRLSCSHAAALRSFCVSGNRPQATHQAAQNRAHLQARGAPRAEARDCMAGRGNAAELLPATRSHRLLLPAVSAAPMRRRRHRAWHHGRVGPAPRDVRAIHPAGTSARLARGAVKRASVAALLLVHWLLCCRPVFAAWQRRAASCVRPAPRALHTPRM